MDGWLISEALSNVRRFEELKPRLTDEEVEHLIMLEEAAQRRQSFLNKLYREARVRASRKFSKS